MKQNCCYLKKKGLTKEVPTIVPRQAEKMLYLINFTLFYFSFSTKLLSLCLMQSTIIKNCYYAQVKALLRHATLNLRHAPMSATYEIISKKYNYFTVVLIFK